MSDIAEINKVIGDSRMNSDMKEVLRVIVSCFSKLVSSKNDTIEKLETRVDELEMELGAVKDHVDNYSQYERRDTFIISGQGLPKEEQGEDCKDKVLKLLNETLDVNLVPTDISICHRLGKVVDRAKSRNIIIKLCRRDIISPIYRKIRELRPNFYINDSQTPTRAKISYILRQLKKKDDTKIVAVLSSQGDPVALVPTRPIRSSQRITSSQAEGSSGRQRIPTKRVTITNRMQLEEFVRDYFGSTLQEQDLFWDRPRQSV